MTLVPSTLQSVVKKCLEDEGFFEAVIRNPASALEKAELRLSEAEYASLEKMVGNVKVTDIPGINSLVNDFRGLRPGDWEPGWPMGWLPRGK